jgi:hypothetical protein
MGRTKDKKTIGSPSENSVATTDSINRRQQQKTSPDHDNSSRRQQQTMTSKRSLSYDDHDDSDDSKTEASNNDSKHNTFSNKGSNTNLSLNRQQKKMKSNDDKTNLIPEVIRSGDRNDDAISSIMPFSVTNTKFFAEEENSAFPRNLKAMITNTIRTQIFRRIKFLNYEKLSLESNIFKLLFHTTGYHDKQEQQIKYEPLREIVQRQMNSKRNYCTDQILAKARGKNVGLYYVPY